MSLKSGTPSLPCSYSYKTLPVFDPRPGLASLQSAHRKAITAFPSPSSSSSSFLTDPFRFRFDLDSFPSSAAFDAINTALQADAAERKDAVKKGNAVFSFTLKNAGGETESWYIDLKEKGEVKRGEAPEGGKADGMFSYPNHHSGETLHGRNWVLRH